MSHGTSWIPASVNAPLWHQVRARADLGSRYVGELLGLELAKIIDPSLEQIPYQQIPRLAGYLKGLGLDSVEHLDAQGAPVLSKLVDALVANPELWPLTRGLWHAGQEAAAAAVHARGSRKEHGESITKTPRAAQSLLTAFARYLDRTHLEHTRLEERHFALLLKEAQAWPAVEMHDSEEGFHPGAANTLQAWAARQLLKAGELLSVEAIDDAVDRATQAWITTLPGGVASGEEAKAIREDIAMSLFSVQPKVCSQAFPVNCLWRWRWLQSTPEKKTLKLIHAIAQDLAGIPTAVLVNLGITTEDAVSMTSSPDSAARSVGILILDKAMFRDTPKAPAMIRETVPAGELSATAAWGKVAQTMRQ